jgi:hypothetical protein
VRFSREFLHTAPRWLVAGGRWAPADAAAVRGCSRGGLAWGTGLHPATMMLGTSPGGIAEMAITAKVLQLGVPVVTAIPGVPAGGGAAARGAAVPPGLAALAGHGAFGPARLSAPRTGVCASSA